MMDLLTERELPQGFSYPPEFLRIVELGLDDLEPWGIIDGRFLKMRHNGLRERYPHRNLVLFAVRQDTDDVACWDADANDGLVLIVHDWASSGWEQRQVFPSFYHWLQAAIVDLINFDIAPATWPAELGVGTTGRY